MGFQSECGTHEGYLVGLVFDDFGLFSGHAGHERGVGTAPPVSKSGRLRELGNWLDGDGLVHRYGPRGIVTHVHDASADPLPVQFARMACSCGWRSPLLRLPRGCTWAPSSLFTPEPFEDAAAKLWHVHVRETGPAPDGGCNVAELVRRLEAQGCRCGHSRNTHTIPYELNLSMRCSVPGCDCFEFRGVP